MHKNKIPLTTLGSAASSIDPATWTDYDTARAAVKKVGADGIGIVLQEPIIGLDLDHCIDRGVINNFARNIISQCRSYTEYSPSGTGVHIYLRGKLNNAVKTKGFELYQNGRFFTVTERAILSLPIRDVTSDFVSSLIPEIAKERRPLPTIIKEIGEGSRNNDLFKIAASLRDKGYSVEAIYGLLEPKAKELNFPLEELELLCRSAGRYEPSVQSVGSGDLASFLAETIKVEWLVPGLIARNSLGFIAGLPETKKTFVVMDLAVEAARGGSWLGRFPVKPAKVLFIDQERFKAETQRRFQGLLKAKGLKPEDVKDNLFVRCGTTTRINLEHSFEAFRKDLREIKPDLVIIDSFATFSTAEENNRMEVQFVIEKIKELRNEIGCSFFFIDHENKSVFHEAEQDQAPSAMKMVGSVAKPAAAEFVFTARKSDDSVMIYNTKNTMAPNQAPFLIDVVDTANGGIQVVAR